ncbi:MAG: aminotransferase class V-fold PLP-dependent enzyme [Desulfobacterales bacterium]|nr:aminotransferase class V-fold PLP-dependent enzyme [Desulfobacterales bacterium]
MGRHRPAVPGSPGMPTFEPPGSYPGNPSSRHEDGRSRPQGPGGRPGPPGGSPGLSRRARLYFTSGGTESDSIPLLALLRRNGPGSLVISSIEHPAVFEQAAVLERLGWKVRRVDPGPDGRVDPGAVADACTGDTVLAAVMAVNNETGAIQPLEAIRRALDAAAGNGRSGEAPHATPSRPSGRFPSRRIPRAPIPRPSSAHKIRGPRGVGALYLRTPLEPLAAGGGQEGGIRSGHREPAGDPGLRARGGNRRGPVWQRLPPRARELTDRLLACLADIPDARPVPECRTPGDERYSPGS